MFDETQDGQAQGEQVKGEAEGAKETEAGEAQETPAPGVKEGVEGAEPKETNNPLLIDEDGVLWKNRAREAERKYQQTLERFANYEKEPKNPEPDPDEEIAPTRGGVKAVLSELQKDEHTAGEILNEVLDSLSVLNPAILTMRARIEKELRGVDVKLRKDPKFIKVVSTSVFGDEMLNKKPDTVKSPTKKLIQSKGSDVLNPSPAGGGNTQVRLSPEEEAYAFQHRLPEKGFTAEEIQGMFIKATSKKKSD